MTVAMIGNPIVIAGIDRIWRSDPQLSDDIVCLPEGKFQSTKVDTQCVPSYLFTLIVLAV